MEQPRKVTDRDHTKNILERELAKALSEIQALDLERVSHKQDMLNVENLQKAAKQKVDDVISSMEALGMETKKYRATVESSVDSDIISAFQKPVLLTENSN